MLGFLITAIKIIFILGFLVLIHEGGHFFVAKLCKIKVNEFAIGFGPTIWKKQGKETKYALRLIPVGGFVSMEGEDQRSDDERSFSKSSIPKRIAVVLAGGLVNIIFALIVYFVLMASLGNNISNNVDKVVEGSNAQIAGLQANDKIISINNKKIHNKADFDAEMDKCDGSRITIEVERNGEKLKFDFEPTEEKYNYTGIAIQYNEKNPNTKIAALYKNSPGALQGLEINDVIVKVNGTDVENSTNKLVELINKEQGKEIVFTVQRGNNILDISIMPEVKSEYYLGVYLKMAEKNLSNNLYYAFYDTADFAFSIIDNLKMLFTGNVSIDQFVGPVGIGEVVAKTTGFSDFIYILALVSISLGFTNLLPFPPLDGGKVVLLLIEAIRRKPLKEQTEMTIQMIGFMLLMGLSVYVTYNDILRIF